MHIMCIYQDMGVNIKKEQDCLNRFKFHFFYILKKGVMRTYLILKRTRNPILIGTKTMVSSKKTMIMYLIVPRRCKSPL